MVWVRDELVRESCQFLTATTGRLTGAVANYTRFRDAKRRDGTAIATGDTAIVNIIQSPAGRAICKATLTFGAEDTFALDGTAPHLKKSTAGAGLPGFSAAGQPGEIAIVSFAEEVALDGDGNLQSPDKFRKSILKPFIMGGSGFTQEVGSVDDEGVFALALSAQLDGLGGPVMFDADASDAQDSLDVWGTGTGRYLRPDTVLARTRRPAAVANGDALAVVPASVAGRAWLVHAFDTTGVHRATAIVHGHASDPQVDVLFEFGALVWEVSSTTVSVRNQSGASLTLRFLRTIISTGN